MTLADHKLRLSIDVLEEGEVVHVTGPEGGLMFGTVVKPRVWWGSDEFIGMISTLERHLHDKDELPQDINKIGKSVFQSLINTDPQINSIYSNYIGHGGQRPQDLSISFRVDTKYLNLPVEFMMDLNKTPVAARIPIFKTITTTELYGKREDLNPRDKLKVLLISSNTNVSKEKDVLMGNEKLGGIELNSVPQLDQPNNEIDTVSDILRESKGKDGTPNVEIQKIPTSQIYYSKFLKILENEEFDVIHYNGHGYFNKEDPERSFIAFWEKEDSKGNVMALTTNDLYSALNRSKKLKLVYLSCCEGGEIGSSYQKTYNNFLGLIEPVINAGVPNVIAMRWPIPVHYAKSLASNFYTALFLQDDFGTIESAMSRARLLALKEPPAWCCPILVKQDF